MTRVYGYKEKAQRIFQHAIASGKLPPRITWCQLCGRDKIQYKVFAHHADYDYPFSVVYLCARHHNAIHKWIKTQEPSEREEIPEEHRVPKQITEPEEEHILPKYMDDSDWGYL